MKSDSRSTVQLLRILLLGVACVLATHSAHAQVLYGSLVGEVADPSRAVLPGATVTVTNKDTGLQRETTTDGSGSYAFRDLQAGTYDLKVIMAGFKSYVKGAVPVTLNAIARADVQMEVGGQSETVNVTAKTILQTERADVSTQLTSAQVTNLPIGSGRNFQQLYKLIPGASPPVELHSDAGNPQRSLGTNFNGVSRSNNNTRLDGATVSYPWLPHIMAYVPAADAVDTVNIVTNSFDAEQGMAGGAAVSVSIKSGTNEFRGSGQAFHTNSAWRAKNRFFVGNEIPKNLFNQYGGTFGGPIKKNKLFFFGNWERTSRRQTASAERTIPTDLLRSGDFSGTGALIYDPNTGNPDGSGRQLFPDNKIPANRIDPAALKMILLLPAPNQATFPRNYFATGTYEFDRDNLDFKVNYNPGTRGSVFARYSISPSDIFDPPSLGAAGGDALNGGQPGRAPGRIQSTAVGATYTVSNNVLLDANFGFTRQRLGAENIDIGTNHGLETLGIPGTNGPDRLQGGYPRFNITGFSALGNPNVSNPFSFSDNQYVAVGNLSWLKGSHWMRFGAEYTYYTINHFQPQAAFGPRGGFNFTGGLTSLRGGAAPTVYNGFADFLLGLPQSMGKDLQFVNPASVRMPSYGVYARDQWQINRQLTLNYGMRYEYYPFATRADRGGERYDPITDEVIVGGLGGNPQNAGVDVGSGQLAPRLGIAYRVTEKTVARVGFGISVDPNSFRNLRDAYPATISSQFSGASTFQAAGSLRTGIPAVALPDLSQGVLVLPKTVGTQTFPADFNRGYIQSFNATVQHEIGAGIVGQAAYVGTRAIRQTANVNINAAGPGGGAAGRALFPQFGRTANINSLMPFRDATYDSLQTQLTRRLSGSSMLGLSYTFSKAMNYADNSDSGLIWNYEPEWERNRARADFDRPHNLQLYGVYELPFGSGRKWANDGLPALIAGGWQLNGVFSATSGTPFTVTSAGTSLNAPGNSQTADQVLPTVTILGGVGRGNSYFDPAAFAPVTEVRFGNSGRNSLRGPGLMNLDASLFRDFRIASRYTMQFRAEVFNVTNRPAFNNPGANASSATRAADGTIINLNGYTEITSAQATERQLRFALRLRF
ncbi:MAG TPA: TonB-dependent receptor [Vicinamibacterales bacterium]|nr:TonB-dependent receptor [Vicinamibacterales bacterium]